MSDTKVRYYILYNLFSSSCIFTLKIHPQFVYNTQIPESILKNKITILGFSASYVFFYLL